MPDNWLSEKIFKLLFLKGLTWIQVTDITYLRTYEGWLFLAIIIGPFPRQVIDWSVGPRLDRELAINALLMAVWRRQPQSTALVHSDQGSQFSSYDWQAF